jgi:3-oxoacyl-[acyl-carrier protein] reductase
MLLQDKLAVVTGAARGSGAAIALAFARRGAQLALIDLPSASAPVSATAARCQASGVTVRAYDCDVSDEQQVVQAYQRIAADFGRLDLQVNNAGILRDGLLVKVEQGQVVRTLSLEQWRAVLDVNLTGTFLCGREAAAHMIRFGHGGVIINLSSISRHGNFGQTNYSAAKAGVAAMAVVWARELARYGIRAASIAPGIVHTEMMAALKPDALAKLTNAVPLRRSAEPDEIAHAAVFIAENDFFTGRCLELDGGLSM